MKRLTALPALWVLVALACNAVAPPAPGTPAAPTLPVAEPSPAALPSTLEVATAEADVEPVGEPSATPETPMEASVTVEAPQPTEAPTPIPNGRWNPNPPENPVRLVFIHHSSGGNWLADPAENGSGGDLGRALMENNYFVSATNYGWGPDAIGDRTDIGNWGEWFGGPNSATYLQALYGESEPNFGDFGSWPRLATAPDGENEIVVFKSCFPNSAINGQPTDPPQAGQNPLRGEAAGSDTQTVANAKGIYVDLLDYFATRPDKLFVVITAPPLHSAETSPEQAANARAFNRWLVEDWLQGYAHSNVAVFDYYTVLTSNGGSNEQNDLDRSTGNHHRYRAGGIEYMTDQGGNTSAYAVEGDSHPTAAGNQKATAEFVPLLNIFYHRWQAGQ